MGTVSDVRKLVGDVWAGLYPYGNSPICAPLEGLSNAAAAADDLRHARVLLLGEDRMALVQKLRSVGGFDLRDLDRTCVIRHRGQFASLVRHNFGSLPNLVSEGEAKALFPKPLRSSLVLDNMSKAVWKASVRSQLHVVLYEVPGGLKAAAHCEADELTEKVQHVLMVLAHKEADYARGNLALPSILDKCGIKYRRL